MEKRLMTMLVGLFLLVGGVLAQTKVPKARRLCALPILVWSLWR